MLPCRGYSRLILKYEADIACTAAILLSKFSGSAMKKNLSRLQGVVLGLVTGALGFALLGRCEFIFQLGLTLFLWAWLVSDSGSPSRWCLCKQRAVKTGAFFPEDVVDRPFDATQGASRDVICDAGGLADSW